MLKVHIFPDKVQSGAAAAARGASLIRQALQNYGTANIVVATAPSQNEMYDALVAEKDLDWGKVNIFHLDEYIGLDDHHPASFRFNLHKTFLDRLPIPPMGWGWALGLSKGGGTFLQTVEFVSCFAEQLNLP